MTTLLQLILPAFLFWLIWRAFRSPRRDSDSPNPGSDSSPGGCAGHDSGSCDGGGGGD